MLKTIRLAIGIPAYRGAICAYQAQMWLAFGQALERVIGKEFEIVLGLFVDITGVERARNRLLHDAMAADADWLLMIDSDTWVESQDVAASPLGAGVALLRMIGDAAMNEIAVIAAPVRISLLGEKAIAAYKRFEDGTSKQLYTNDVAKGIQDVDEVGAAVMAINLHAALACNAKFEFTDALSEDREFCRQMRAAGHRVALDGRVRTGHLSREIALYSE